MPIGNVVDPMTHPKQDKLHMVDWPKMLYLHVHLVNLASQECWLLTSIAFLLLGYKDQNVLLVKVIFDFTYKYSQAKVVPW